MKAVAAKIAEKVQPLFNIPTAPSLPAIHKGRIRAWIERKAYI